MTNAHDPINAVVDQNGDASFGGLTKREYFAAMAMQGLAGSFAELGRSHSQIIAKCAVEISDALIEALNKTPQQ
jgi:hypothetical protein